MSLALLVALIAPWLGQGGPARPPAPQNAAANPNADFFLLSNRQKYIGLTGYFPGVEYDALSFSIIQATRNGRLLGTPPNLLYVPNKDFVGADSLVYEAKAEKRTSTRTVTLSVDSKFVTPLGIPPPDFGINESHRMYAWREYSYAGTVGSYKDAGAGPYTHYVDANRGSDAHNPFGTKDRPRRTLPQSLPEGSVVEVHGNNITCATRFVIRGDGTPQAPIFIRGASPTEKSVFRSPMSVEGNYIICENLEFDCRDLGPGTTGANWFWVTNTDTKPYHAFHHVCLRHSLMHDQPTADHGQNPGGVVVGVRHFDPALNDPNLLVHHVVVYDVEVRNFSTWNNFSGTDDYYGCGFFASSRNCWVLDCHVHHLRGPGTAVSRASGLSKQGPGRNIYIGRNYIHNCKETAISYKNAMDCVFSQNLCHTFRRSYSSLGYAAVLIDDDPTPDWPGADNIWILFNTIYDSENGILHELRNTSKLPADKHSRSYIVGNLLFDIRLIRGNPKLDGVAIHKGQLGESRMVGNTIYNCDLGIWLGLAGLSDAAHTTQVVRNNAIVNLTQRYREMDGKDAMHIFLTPSSILPFTTIDHNLHFQDAGGVRFTITKPGMVTGEYLSIQNLLVATGLGGQSLEADPRFVDPAHLDFHLESGSPAAGAGTADEVYDKYKKRFLIPVMYYLDGTPKSATHCAIGALPEARPK